MKHYQLEWDLQLRLHQVPKVEVEERHVLAQTRRSKELDWDGNVEAQ